MFLMLYKPSSQFCGCQNYSTSCLWKAWFGHQCEAFFHISHLVSGISFWNHSVSRFLSQSDLSLPWSLVSGPSQNHPGLFSILFVPGNWTVNCLSLVVNNTQTWYALQCLSCLAVTDSLLGVADLQTGCVGSFLISTNEHWQRDEQAGGPFILLSRFFCEEDDAL